MSREIITHGIGAKGASRVKGKHDKLIAFTLSLKIKSSNVAYRDMQRMFNSISERTRMSWRSGSINCSLSKAKGSKNTRKGTNSYHGSLTTTRSKDH